MEFLEFGDLDQYDTLSVPQIDVTLQQVCSAVKFLHDCNVIHRDLKPGNILVKSLYPIHVVVADFGLASKDDLITFGGNLMCSAPEIFTGEPYKSSVDVWSIGIIMLLFSSVREPEIPKYSDARLWLQQWLQFVNNWKQEKPIKTGLEHFIELAKVILISEPTERLQIQHVVERVDNHIRFLIRGFIKNDPKQQPPKAICLTDLLDYMSLDKATANRIANTSLRMTCSYKVQRPKNSLIGRRRDVYVELRHALNIVENNAPRLTSLVADVVKEVEAIELD